MNRREFLGASAAGLGAAALHGCAVDSRRTLSARDERLDVDDWESVRRQFDLPPGKVLLSGFFLTNVPRPVKAEIERYRGMLDADPLACVVEHKEACEQRVRRIAGQYMGVAGERDIALTDSTTMGLGLLYSGLSLREGDEVVTTVHDHWATHGILDIRAARSGATLRKLALYDNGAAASVDQIVTTLRGGLSPRTRVLALTWVHSCTGVKLPLAQIAAVVREENARRNAEERVLFCVDGVHGFGIENATMAELGCDFFSAGTHKWILGPRGTGVLWGREALWERVAPSITPFSRADGPGPRHTPGGFHTFENRWAVDAAFQFHLDLGKPRVTERLHALNGRIREGLAEMKHVTLHTPMSPELSAGITCFEVRGLTVDETVARLTQRGIIASESPYTPSYARLAACLWNTSDEVDAALAEVARLA